MSTRFLSFVPIPAWPCVAAVLVVAATAAMDPSPPGIVFFVRSGEGAQPDTMTLRLGPVVHVSSDRSDVPHGEVHLSIDPGNPERMIAAAAIFPDAQPHLVEAFHSADEGRTWSRRRLPMPAQVAARAWIDPWTAIDESGIAYVSVLAYEARAGESDRIVPWVFRAPASSGRWRRLAAVSAAGGGSYDAPRIATRVDGGLVVVASRWGARSVHDQPTQAVAVVELDRLTGAEASRHQLWEDNVHKSTTNVVTTSDGRVAFGFHEWSAIGSESSWLGRVSTMVSDEAGPQPPNFVTDDMGFGVVWLGLDRGGSTRSAALYAVYPSSGAESLLVRRSVTWGERWTPPAPVGPVSAHPVFSAIAVDRAGRVGVAWTQVSRETEAQRCIETLFSYSADSGRDWAEPIRLLEEPSCLERPGPYTFGTMGGDLAATNEDVGRGRDYLGLAGLENGFYVLWVAAPDGTLQLFGRRLTLGLER